MSYAPVLIAPQFTVTPPRRSAPASVHGVAVLQYLGGVAMVAVGALFAYLCVVATRDNASASEEDFFAPETVAIAFGIVAGVATVCGLVGILLGRKVQVGRQWARVVVLMLSGMTIVSVAGSIALYQAWPWTAVFTLYPVIAIALLNTRSARAFFL
ncbi:hypothetical protein GCM10009557_28820 [Virgisporangium ochraceum]|uniref:Uncharacterized protein n=1 Tax=Virgisporangium ochraceum TaxID=65505 RepID=A0A8J4EH22_9ACTN|nr:hypothetical protein [Virgisporangium ochraceum]GIJ71757.1 hypothetical protein Voc01_066740 [Virgisporangium ochraceum]